MGCGVTSQFDNGAGIDTARMGFSPNGFFLYLSALIQLTVRYYEF